MRSESFMVCVVYGDLYIAYWGRRKSFVGRKETGRKLRGGRRSRI